MGKIIATDCSYIGEATNNVAEFSALIAGLKVAVAHGAKSLEILSDSQLLIRQMTGIYRIKAPHLQKLAMEAAAIVREELDGRVVYRHIPRNENCEADDLANKALDGILKKKAKAENTTQRMLL
jgi:ribonuclease HI